MEGRFVDPWKPKRPGQFRVGDRVRVPFGGTFVEATVVEDHGNLGFGGKRLYGLCFRVDDVADEIHIIREVDRLTLVARVQAPKPTKRKRKRE